MTHKVSARLSTTKACLLILGGLTTLAVTVMFAAIHPTRHPAPNADIAHIRRAGSATPKVASAEPVLSWGLARLSGAEQSRGSLKFDVAIVKPLSEGSQSLLSGGGCLGTDKPGYSNSRYPVGVGTCNLVGYTLKGLLTIAYQPPGTPLTAVGSALDDGLLIGGPEWANTERFQIEAKSADPPATAAQLQQMLQTLLTEQFKITFHYESKDVNGYALVAAKSGSKLKDAGPDATQAVSGRLKNPGQIKGIGKPAVIARQLSLLLQTPVTDETGLDGLYNIDLTWSSNDLAATASIDPAAGPSLFTALREQLGLQLEARNTSIQVFVLDHAEKPAERFAHGRASGVQLEVGVTAACSNLIYRANDLGARQRGRKDRNVNHPLQSRKPEPRRSMDTGLFGVSAEVELHGFST